MTAVTRASRVPSEGEYRQVEEQTELPHDNGPEKPMFTSPIHFHADNAAPVRVILVRTRDRIADAAAATFLVTGIGLFLFARQSLTALANGTYLVPAGMSYVSRADLHTAQSRLGLMLAAIGLAIAIAAALSHSRTRKGKANTAPLAKADA
ncbi:MAG: hypothetical protein U0132_23605 [Gemmatimonadaceae bacterium]